MRIDEGDEDFSGHIFRRVSEDTFTGWAFVADCPIRSHNKDQLGSIVQKELKVLCLHTFRPSRKCSYARVPSGNCEAN